MFKEFLHAFFQMLVSSLPWLFLGLVCAGAIKAFLPDSFVRKTLAGNKKSKPIIAALIGTPLPLCSCSVTPVAFGLRRQGASRGSTVSFLIATPENGIDSIALTLSLLNPLWAVVRVVAALISAISCGLLVQAFEKNEAAPKKKIGKLAVLGQDAIEDKPLPESYVKRLALGMKHSFGKLLKDMSLWLIIGLILAAIIQIAIPVGSLEAYGSGFLAKIIMILVGVPLYICASGSTPLAVGLLHAGISPGTVLVFLLSGPATNIGTIGLVKKELGTRALICYLIGVTLIPLILGMTLDYLDFESLKHVVIHGDVQHHH